MGNPFNLNEVADFCDRHNLWLIEDNCDALASRYQFRGQWKYTSSIGHVGTSASTRRTTSPWVKEAQFTPTILKSNAS